MSLNRPCREMARCVAPRHGSHTLTPPQALQRRAGRVTVDRRQARPPDGADPRGGACWPAHAVWSAPCGGRDLLARGEPIAAGSCARFLILLTAPDLRPRRMHPPACARRAGAHRRSAKSRTQIVRSRTPRNRRGRRSDRMVGRPARVVSARCDRHCSRQPETHRSCALDRRRSGRRMRAACREEALQRARRRGRRSRNRALGATLARAARVARHTRTVAANG